MNWLFDQADTFRSSHRRCSTKIGVPKNFAKFTGKHCVSLFLNKVPGLKACNFIKKETLAQVFSCEFCETLKNTFFMEHFRTTASVHYLLKNTELVSSQSFPHFRTSIRRTTDAPYFANGSGNEFINPLYLFRLISPSLEG